MTQWVNRSIKENGKPHRLIVALGGNALQESGREMTARNQREVVAKTCEYLADLSFMGYEMAIVHGNGPQIGRILLATEEARNVTPAMPFDVCGAMSQGYIGYHIQQCLEYAVHERGRDIPVACVITQVVVSKGDPAFLNPTKPIGPFYNEEDAKRISDEHGYVMKEDAGRGFRRVVASPIPQRIVEIHAVKRMWDTTIVIAAGGGGIPVVEGEDGKLQGVAAVIDKDFAAELLAESLEADTLVILTEVEKIAVNFNKPDQKDIDHMTAEEAERYIGEGHFAPGSMLPKVMAAVKFVKSNPGKRAIITSLYKAADALEGKTGTVISLN